MRDAVVDLCWAAVRHVHGLAVEESNPILVSKGSFFECFVIDAIAAAHHGLIVDAVCKSEAWAEGLVVDVLWALPSVSPWTRPEIGVRAEDISGIRIGEFWIDSGEATKGLAGREIDIVTKAIVQREFGTEPVRILRVEREILIPDAAEISVVKRGRIRKAKERAGYGVASQAGGIAGAAGLSGRKIKLAGARRQAPDVELQHANFAAEFKGVSAFDPTY